MTKNIKRIKDIAERLEIRPQPNESEAEFRVRVGLGVLKQYGDAVEAAEIALGKNWEEFDDLDRNLALLLQFNHHKEKSARYEILNDTYFGMSWEEYESILIGNKFEKVFSYGFKDTNDPNSKEEFAVWVRRDKGFFLTAESYDSKKTVNSTRLYYELSWLIDGKEFDELEKISANQILEDTGSIPCLDDKGRIVTRAIEKDVREGLVEHLQNLEESGMQLNNPWKFLDNHYLFLCDYSETEHDEYDYKASTKGKITLLPKDVQAMIGVKNYE